MGEEKQKIAEDTKELIGIKVLQRAVNHLRNAEKTLQKELISLGDLAIQKLLKEKENKDNQKQKNIQEMKLAVLLFHINNTAPFTCFVECNMLFVKSDCCICIV